MSEEQVDELEQEDRQTTLALKKEGWWSTKALVAPRKIISAELPAAGTDGACQMTIKWKERDEGTQRCFHNMAGLCMDPDPGEIPDSDDRVLAYVGNSTGGSQHGTLGVFKLAGLSRICAQVNVKARVFLHVYSGFRRTDDLQAQLESYSHEDFTVHCVSLDICMARDNADMLSTATIKFWKAKMRDGWVIGVGGGPPCETFTAARLEPAPRPREPTTSPGVCQVSVAETGTKCRQEHCLSSPLSSSWLRQRFLD